MIESLNVSVAAGVCLYEALRQRLAAGMLDVPQLSPDVLAAMASAWQQK
jgi:tRNA (guanosine-2'-O-)-methyltransferase